MQRSRLANITNTHPIDSEHIGIASLFLNNIWNLRFRILISLACCILLSLVYLRYTTPEFAISATLLVRDDSKGSEFGDAEFLESMGLSSVKSSVDNEVEILKSRTLMESVVNDLQLQVRYFATGHIKTSELFDESPYKLTLLTPSENPSRLAVTYDVVQKDNFHYSLQNKSAHYDGKFGDTIRLPQGLAMLRNTSRTKALDDKYSIAISPLAPIVIHYGKALKVAPTNKLVSTVNLSLNDILPKRGEAILESLLTNYLTISLEDKSRIADSTIVFINKNLEQVALELGEAEQSIEEFQKNHGVADIPERTHYLMNALSLHQSDRKRYAMHLQIVDSLARWIYNHPDHIVPAQLFAHDPVFQKLIEKYNELQLSVNFQLTTIPKSHPTIRAIYAQISQLRNDLTTSVLAQQKDLRTSISVLNHDENDIYHKLSKIPATQRQFSELKRQQQIKQDLYIFLLKKRLETSISKSSTLANARVIDKPKSGPEPVKPNRQLIILMSACIGISIPLAASHVKALLSTTISNKSEITLLINAPILSDISHSKEIYPNILCVQKQNQIAEQFRVLRTNILFLSTSRPIQVILLTSSMGGEGKSFIATNLCASFALTSKKIILLEMDLRRPHLAKKLGINSKGFSNFISSNTPLAELVQSYGSINSFDILTAGPAPPNPAELISLPKMNEMICLLKQQYDYIIIDTPPIGLVTDAHLLSRFADLSLYVVRQHFTLKEQLRAIREIELRNQLPRLHLIQNDVQSKKSYNYTYQYYEEKKWSFREAIRNSWKS